MKKISGLAKKLIVVFLLLPLLSFAVSAFLDAFLLDAIGSLSHATSDMHYPFLLALTFGIYLICMIPALLVRFLLLKRPIEKKIILLLVASLIASVGTTSCTMIASSHFDGVGGNLIGLGLFVFLGTYLLLGMKGREGDEELDAEDAMETESRAFGVSGLRDSLKAVAQRGKKAKTPAESLPEQEPVWYFNIEGQTMGPYTRDEMQNRVRRGTITADTLVWNGNAGSAGKGWVTAREAGLLTDAAS